MSRRPIAEAGLYCGSCRTAPAALIDDRDGTLCAACAALIDEIAEEAPVDRILLHTKTPCCGRRVRLEIFDAVPRQKWERTCAECGADWSIAKNGRPSLGSGIRVDLLDWETR